MAALKLQLRHSTRLVAALSFFFAASAFGQMDLTKNTVSINRRSGAPGDRITITLTIINVGVGYLLPSNYRGALIYFYFGEGDRSYSSAFKVGEITAPFSGFHGFPSPEVQFDYVLPSSLAAGEYFLSFWIDAPGLISESNEDNNRFWAKISVIGDPVIGDPDCTLNRSEPGQVFFHNRVAGAVDARVTFANGPNAGQGVGAGSGRFLGGSAVSGGGAPGER